MNHGLLTDRVELPKPTNDRGGLREHNASHQRTRDEVRARLAVVSPRIGALRHGAWPTLLSKSTFRFSAAKAIDPLSLQD